MPPSDAAASDWPEPNLNIPPDHSPEAHRMRARTTWLLARHDYLVQGDTADQVCDRYGLSKSTFHQRARDEGWRRMDQPDAAPVQGDDPEDDAPVDCQTLSDDALVRVRRALRRGRAAEAASWMRLHEKLEHRLAARREQVRRQDRVIEARGSAVSRGALDPMIEELNAITAIAETQTALEKGLADGSLDAERYAAFSARNMRLAQALGGPSGPDSPDSVFSDDDDDGRDPFRRDDDPPS